MANFTQIQFSIMDVHILNEGQSIFNQYVAELRDVKIQKDSLRFRRNLERIGEIIGYEISKVLTYKTKDVVTPLELLKKRYCKIK